MSGSVTFAGMTLLTAAAMQAGEAGSRLGQGEALDIPFWRLALGLVLCIALAGTAVLLARRSRTGGTGAGLFGLRAGRTPRIRILEACRVGSSAEVCLIVCDGREYLIASTQGQVVLLSENRAEDPPESSGSPSS